MRAITLLLVLAACSTKPRTALDYVAVCSPGQYFRQCNRALAALSPRRKGPFPVNDLVAIKADGVRLFSGPGPHIRTKPTRGAFKRMMYFRDGYGTVRARVLALIEEALGESTRIKGSPPIDDLWCPGGDYWIASDGLWILSETMVTWYSTPFEGLPPDNKFPWDDAGGKYKRAAPFSAALWRKIGHVLVTY